MNVICEIIGMKNLKFKFILLLFGLLVLSPRLYSQVPDEIVISIQNGNVEKLASFFNQNVELVVQGYDDVYSKSQAKQIVAEFFKRNKPKQFNLVRQGGKEGAPYVIGTLVTGNGTFRVSILLKNKENISYIHQLRIVSL